MFAVYVSKNTEVNIIQRLFILVTTRDLFLYVCLFWELDQNTRVSHFLNLFNSWVLHMAIWRARHTSYLIQTWIYSTISIPMNYRKQYLSYILNQVFTWYIIRVLLTNLHSCLPPCHHEIEISLQFGIPTVWYYQSGPSKETCHLWGPVYIFLHSTLTPEIENVQQSIS